MRDPDPNEEYVIVVDNKERKSIQHVECCERSPEMLTFMSM